MEAYNGDDRSTRRAAENHEQGWPRAVRSADIRPPGAELAAWLLMARRLREEVLGAELFSDPAWDILLDIYAGEARGQRIQISSLAPVNGVPSSTARRWAHKLIRLGLLERQRDEHDGRLTYVRLSPMGRERILLFIERLLAKRSPAPIIR